MEGITRNKPENILILGASGFIGCALLQKLSRDNPFSVIGTYHRHLPTVKTGGNLSLQEMDVTLKSELNALLHKTNPDCIINTIAISTIDACEKDRQQCDHINVEPTKIIIDYCRDKPRVKYIFFSSDHVFDGTKNEPYTEKDLPAPANYYGATKLHCEEMITSALQNYAIIRPCLVYGMPRPYQHPNLFTTIYNTLQQHKKFQAYTDKVRSPCYLEDIPAAVEQIIRKNKKGIFLVGGETMLVYEFARKIAEYFDLDQKLIIGVKSAGKEKVPRPKNCALDNSFTKQNLGVEFSSLTEALRQMKGMIS